ncbi:Dabb family protein [Clostridium sp. BJN0001]|uniref:Dabb family protein n=1 Tax=Clostridium sp. BJN0001 TaxID=2930219 RepID=UPI001FD43F81|nr:Dabb family protein [Clostridium sp. BJN0001]
MFTHIVLFKAKNPTKENLEFLKNTFLKMDGKVSVLRKLEVGVDLIRSDRSYDVGIITRFDNKEDYLTYDVHPFHVNEVKKVIKPYIECSKTLDFE